MHTRFLILLLLLFGLGPRLFSQVVIRGPYLQNPTQQAVVVCWRTDVPTSSRVVFGTSSTALNQSVTDTILKTNHFVALSGLSAYTKYYYNIGTVSTLFAADTNQCFRTFPTATTVQPVRIWALGDFGKGNSNQAAVRDAFEQFNADRKTDLWIWLGDNAYADGKDEEYQNKVFDSIYGYRDVMKYLPFHPCPGNHDYNTISPVTSTVNPNNHSGPYYDMIRVPQNGEVGGVASNKKLYYSFDYANIHFVSINSELGSIYNASHDWIGASPLFSFNGSAFTQWLEQDLAANQQKWCIAYFHQPPYTDGSHESEAFWEVYMKAMRKNIVPILEQYGVDLVLSGHSHVYERSYLIKGLYGDDNTFNPATMLIDGSNGGLATPYVKYLQGPNTNVGTVYVVSGNGGSNDDAPGLQHPVMFYGDGCDTCVGSFIVDVWGDTLRGRYLSASGAFKDDFYIVKSAQSSLVAPKTAYFDLFPNPTQNRVFIKRNTFNTSGQWRLSVYDVAGNLLLAEREIGEQAAVDLGAFAETIFLFVFKDEFGQYYKEQVVKK